MLDDPIVLAIIALVVVVLLIVAVIAMRVRQRRGRILAAGDRQGNGRREGQ
jgi:hypothetical protein